MKRRIVRDRRNRKSLRRHERRRRAIKYARREGLISPREARLRLAQLPRNSSPVRVKRYCVHTNRGRGVLRDWKVSRRNFRERAVEGALPGIRKATW